MAGEERQHPIPHLFRSEGDERRRDRSEVNELTALMESGDSKALRTFLKVLHPADMAALAAGAGRGHVIRTDNPLDLGDIFDFEVYDRLLRMATSSRRRARSGPRLISWRPRPSSPGPRAGRSTSAL